MKIIFFILCLSFLISCAPNSYTSRETSSQRETQIKQIQDLDGWDKTKWGMTPDEVRNLYVDRLIPSQEKELEKIIVPFVIEGIKIDGTDFKARFIFDKHTNKLQAVVLQAARDQIDEELFEKFQKYLVSKYGVPLSNDKKIMAGLKIIKQMWAVDKTQIDFTYLIDNNKIAKGLFIKYSDRSNQID